jgi:AraC-like DNA-binding protein
VDAVANLLDGPRARGAFLLRALFAPPWSVRIADRAPLSLVAVVRGEAWLLPDDGAATRLVPGDVAVLRGPEPYRFADAPDTPTQVVIHPGQRCTTVDGVDLHDRMTLGVRSWGNDPHGGTVLLIGTYQLRTATSRRLLAALPAALVVPRDERHAGFIPLLDEEITQDRPGQDVVLDRMLDLLLIAVLRTWFAQPADEQPAWHRAPGDPVVGPALRLLHEEPARPWTVAALAARTGVSRATLARRFTELVGEPPMTYLTGWRLALAADLLREPDATIGSVARRVGYGSAFALSAAFKRVHGVSPREHRAGPAGGDAAEVAA